jgi:type IV pilus assembly protein PilA
MLSKFRKSQQGFTLIELLIVVAIIGILAAIAIPQFAAYRIRGFNSAANSDVRNVATAQEALFADTQGYGTIDDTPTGATLANNDALDTASLQAGPLNGATANNDGAFLYNALGAIPFSISNGVVLGGTLTITEEPLPIVGTSYVLTAKHTQGDSCYGRDSDSTSMFRAGAAPAGTALVGEDVVTATQDNDDLNNQGSGICANFTVM